MQQLIYRVLVPGQLHFDCRALLACLSTVACAERWRTASKGSTCAGCAIGGQHAQDAGLEPTTSKSHGAKSCVRCGRTDLRVIRVKELCISCWNRERELLIGRNAKGTRPIGHRPLHHRAVGTISLDGTVKWRAVLSAHKAEAVGFVARKLQPREKLAAVQPGRIVWDAAADRFALACSCGSGLLECITSGGTLRHHCPDCGGLAPAGDWRPAVPREPVVLFHPSTAATWMAGEDDQPGDTWAAAPFGCGACQEGVIEARQHAGQIECRCSACGATGASGCWM